MSADENLAKLTLEAIEKLNLAMSELFKLPKMIEMKNIILEPLGIQLG